MEDLQKHLFNSMTEHVKAQRYSDELIDKKVKKYYEDLSDEIDDTNLVKLNNIFCYLCGVSLETLINSEDETLTENFFEPPYAL